MKNVSVDDWDEFINSQENEDEEREYMQPHQINYLTPYEE